MIKYKLTNKDNIVIDVEHDPINYVVIDAEDNQATLEYKEWLANGNTPDAYDNSDYKEDRKLNYKPLAEQLDMQYWDKVNGTTTWQDHINEVKAKYPKPTV